MPITRQKKEEIVSSLANIFDNAATTVFVHFHGLDVESEREMRSALKEEGVGYTVARKTLAKIAMDNTDVKGDIPSLEGELAFAFSSPEKGEDVDITAPARLIHNFGEKFGGAVSIMGGIFEREYTDKEKMGEIAQIPSLEVLRGMFANVINSPIQGLAVSLSALAEKRGE